MLELEGYMHVCACMCADHRKLVLREGCHGDRSGEGKGGFPGLFHKISSAALLLPGPGTIYVA